MIVGIIADAHTESLADAGVPQVYASAYQKTSKHLAIFLRGPVDTPVTAERVREIVQSLDATLPVFGAAPLNSAVSGSLAARRFAMQIVGLFAITALLLAALGIYGVMSYTITARTQEIGIRLALGAPRERMFAEIIRDGLALAVVGTVAGVLCAVVVARLMTGVLYGIRPLDPMRRFTVRRRVDAVLISGRSFSYMTKNEDVLNTLRCVRRSLRPHGVLVFDSFDARTIFADLSHPMRDVVRVGDKKISRVSTRTANLRTGWTWNWDARYLVEEGGRRRTFRDQSVLRAFTRDELAMFLALAGFTSARIRKRGAIFLTVAQA